MYLHVGLGCVQASGWKLCLARLLRLDQAGMAEGRRDGRGWDGTGWDWMGWDGTCRKDRKWYSRRATMVQVRLGCCKERRLLEQQDLIRQNTQAGVLLKQLKQLP